MIYDFHRIDGELVCPECWRSSKKCICDHDPNSCPALFLTPDGMLLRCDFDPGHDDPDWHESGDWGWVSDEFGMPPIPEPEED